MDPTDRKFDNWIFNLTVKKTIECFQKNSELIPVFTGYTNKEVLILPTLFKGTEEKHRMLKTYKMLFAVLGVEHYTVSHESWYVECDNNKSRQSMPESIEDAPGRKEGVCIMSISEKRKMYRMFEIKRENGEVTLDTEVTNEVAEISGLFTELLGFKKFFDQMPIHSRPSVKDAMEFLHKTRIAEVKSLDEFTKKERKKQNGK